MCSTSQKKRPELQKKKVTRYTRRPLQSQEDSHALHKETPPQFHEKCKRMIEAEIYSLHDVTCKKQAKWSQEQTDEAPLDKLQPLKETILELKEKIARLESQKQNREENPVTSNSVQNARDKYRYDTTTTRLGTKQTDQETNTVETNEPTDNNTDTSKNSTDSNATDSTDSSENYDDTASTDNSGDPDNNDINNDDRIATNENTDSNDNNNVQRPANNDDIEAYTINEPNIALRHTYNPQDNAQLLKINLTDAYTVTATYIGTTIDAEALFRQHGPCNNEHHATKDKDIKAIIIRYQMKNGALKVINKYKEYIQQTNDDVQRPTTEQQTNQEKRIEYIQTPDTICVRVPGHTTRQNLTDTFQQLGNIIDVRHLEPKDGQNGRYTAFIQFENQDSAERL
ncbi:probable serine/threonine-protein kinase dyrk1 [Nasonia vitripennis]|uniref:RRM domain-containing protein n=1 Tax=Nasonia vitripennis TaxID=7425 RepID=A0A7M7QDN4_NASVI|nr:probable serine/threonine-protein kinase dyrk1 [Nasonia vitripennis]